MPRTTKRTCRLANTPDTDCAGPVTYQVIFNPDARQRDQGYKPYRFSLCEKHANHFNYANVEEVQL